MKFRKFQSVAYPLLLIVFARMHMSAQAPQSGASTETINVNSGRPIADAIEALENRYRLPITYEDPGYVHPSDLKDVTAAASKHPEDGRRAIVPRGGPFQFQYAVQDGKPQEDTQSLIHRMLTEYAAQGGPLFDVQGRAIAPTVTEWHVIPVQSRNLAGQFVDQPALLDNIITIEQGKHRILEIFGDMCQQLSQMSGRRVGIGSVPFNVLGDYELDFGATNRRARDVLAELLEKRGRMVWQLFYDPGVQWYMLNIHLMGILSNSQYSTRPPTVSPSGASPATPKTRDQVRLFLPRLYERLRTPEGISAIQSALASAGFYHGQPTRAWDPATIDAVKAFQAANGIQPTGVPDPLTLHKLNLDTEATVPKLARPNYPQ